MIRPNAHQTIGNLGGGADTVKGTCPVNGSAGSGRAFTITPVVGLGRQWIGDKDANARRFAAQAKADRIAAARDRLMDRVGHSHLACRFGPIFVGGSHSCVFGSRPPTVARPVRRRVIRIKAVHKSMGPPNLQSVTKGIYL